MDPMNITNKMLSGYNQVQGNFDFRPLAAKLQETEAMARRYQSGTPAKINFAPLIQKLREAAAIGAELQRKAKSGNL